MHLKNIFMLHDVSWEYKKRNDLNVSINSLPKNMQKTQSMALQWAGKIQLAYEQYSWYNLQDRPQAG